MRKNDKSTLINETTQALKKVVIAASVVGIIHHFSVESSLVVITVLLTYD